MIVTYQADDRIVGLLDLFDQIKIKEILLNGEECGEKYCKQLSQKIEKNNIPVVYPKSKDESYWARGLRITTMNPAEDPSLTKGDSLLRNNSLVFRLVYGEVSLYLSGEGTEFIEERVLYDFSFVPVAILKVSNIELGIEKPWLARREKTASESLLKTLRPENAIIFVGKEEYESPAEEVLSRLNDHGVKIYRTDENGTIIFTTDGKNYQIETER